MDEEFREVIDLALESALEMIDRATLALYLSRHTTTCAQRLKFAQQALDTFAASLVQLEQMKEEMRVTESWQVWYEEAQKGLVSAKALFTKSGA